MFDKLTYKNKCLALFGGFVLFMFIVYEFSLSDTLRLSDDIKEREQKLSWLKEKEKELPALKARMAEFEKAYSRNDSMAVRDKLTAFISDFAEKNNCLVTEIPVNSSFKNENLNVQTNSFTIKGNFNNLLTLLHRLENEYKYVAKIMSSKFYAVKDMQTKRKHLYLTIITQSFEQKNT
jgi:hypothetical protein